MKTDYSLIIPAWNEAAFIGHTLQHVLSAMQRLEENSGYAGQLIVVDNNSTDDTADIARSHGATVVFEDVNQIARARNRGAMASTGEVLVFLDADTTCSDKLLGHVLDLVATNQVAGGGSVIAPDREIKGTPLLCIRLWNWTARTARLAAGCFVFCRKDAFEAIGGFSEKVYAGEEIFLSRSLKRWGRRHQMRFEVVGVDPVITSVRKLDWYTPMQLARQVVLILIPGAVFSKRLCRTWYDAGEKRGKHD